MSRTTRSFSQACAVALGLALVAFYSSVAQAASISYGSFGPVGGATFVDVTESSSTDPVPLYGPPNPFPIGLDFNPTNFVAVSQNDGSDITDGQLNFMVSRAAGIPGLSVFEAGDYTLVGTGTAATNVSAGAIILASIVEVNGAAVAPINLPPVNATFGANLAANAGIVQPWSLGATIATVLGPNQLATKINFAINNTLAAVSEPTPGSGAFIAKKEFIVRIVPEPSTFAMAGLLLCGLAFTGRKRG
jgi:hypothetical protein